MRRPCSITSLVQEGSPPAVAEDPQRLLPRACGHRCGVQLAASCGEIWRVRKYRGSADYTPFFREKTELVQDDGRFQIDPS
jgi:hypothetical protein